MPTNLPILTGQPTPPNESVPLTRRGFLGVSSATVLSCILAQACGGDGPTGVGPLIPPPQGSVSFVGGAVTMQLNMIPALTANDGFQVVGLSEGNRRADIVVINVGGTFKAFSSICTHQACTVTDYANQRILCPCHGSQFNQNGQPVAGPAPTALREFPVTLNATAQTLTISV